MAADGGPPPPQQSTLDPVIDRSDMHGDLIHIVGRVSWYMRLAQLFEPESWADERVFADGRAATRQALVDLYRHVLLLEMNCLCASAGESNAAARDSVSWDDFRSLVRNVMVADDAVVDMIRRSCTEDVGNGLLALDADFEPPADEGRDDGAAHPSESHE